MAQGFVYNSRKADTTLATSIKSEVFEAAKHGDSEAFAIIYRFYFSAIFRFIFYRTNHQQTAEDLTEQVFSKAWLGLAKLEGDQDKLQGWLYRIARNVVIDNFRSTKEVVGIEALETLPSYEATAVETMEVAGDQQTLLVAISKLPLEQQTVIKLRFLEDLNIDEIAGVLGKTEGNVRIIQFRALKALRIILEGKNDT